MNSRCFHNLLEPNFLGPFGRLIATSLLSAGDGTCTSIQAQEDVDDKFLPAMRTVRNSKEECQRLAEGVLDSTSQFEHRPFGRVTHGCIGVLSKFLENRQKSLFPAVAHGNRDVA